MLLREFQAKLGFSAPPQPVEDEPFLSVLLLLLLLSIRAFCGQTASFQLTKDLFSPCEHRAGVSPDFVVFIMESRDWTWMI
jgi:hypothetical protein